MTCVEKCEISLIFNSEIDNVCTVEFASMYIMHVRCESKFCFTDHFNFLQRYIFIRHTNTNSDPNTKTNASVIVGKYVRHYRLGALICLCCILWNSALMHNCSCLFCVFVTYFIKILQLNTYKNSYIPALRYGNQKVNIVLLCNTFTVISSVVKLLTKLIVLVLEIFYISNGYF